MSTIKTIKTEYGTERRQLLHGSLSTTYFSNKKRYSIQQVHKHIPRSQPYVLLSIPGATGSTSNKYNLYRTLGHHQPPGVYIINVFFFQNGIFFWALSRAPDFTKSTQLDRCVQRNAFHKPQHTTKHTHKRRTSCKGLLAFWAVRGVFLVTSSPHATDVGQKQKER